MPTPQITKVRIAKTEDEYVCRAHINNPNGNGYLRYPAGDYYASDLEDAKQTRIAMLQPAVTKAEQVRQALRESLTPHDTRIVNQFLSVGGETPEFRRLVLQSGAVELRNLYIRADSLFPKAQAETFQLCLFTVIVND